MEETLSAVLDILITPLFLSHLASSLAPLGITPLGITLPKSQTSPCTPAEASPVLLHTGRDRYLGALLQWMNCLLQCDEYRTRGRCYTTSQAWREKKSSLVTVTSRSSTSPTATLSSTSKGGEMTVGDGREDSSVIAITTAAATTATATTTDTGLTGTGGDSSATVSTPPPLLPYVIHVPGHLPPHPHMPLLILILPPHPHLPPLTSLAPTSSRLIPSPSRSPFILLYHTTTTPVQTVTQSY